MMVAQHPANRTGFSIIEALVAVAMISVIFVVLGRSLSSVHKSYIASDRKDRAVAYAREYLDIVHEIMNDTTAFACKCGGVCSPPCTAGDGQQCTGLPGYKNCWVQYPIHDNLNSYCLIPAHQVSPPPSIPDPYSCWPVKAVNQGGTWFLMQGSDNSDPVFTRSIAIKNLCRDANDNFATCGTPNYQTKKVTVTVSWPELGTTKQVQLSEIFTGWKNLP